MRSGREVAHRQNTTTQISVKIGIIYLTSIQLQEEPTYLAARRHPLVAIRTVLFGSGNYNATSRGSKSQQLPPTP